MNSRTHLRDKEFHKGLFVQNVEITFEVNNDKDIWNERMNEIVKQ